MNEDMRSKLSGMVENDLIRYEDFLFFFRRPSNISLKKLMQSQYVLHQDKIDSFKITLFDKWQTCTTIFPQGEIIVLNQLINNSFVLSRKELLRKTKLSQGQLSDAIRGLQEEQLIEVITHQQNEKIIFISKKKFMELIEK